MGGQYYGWITGSFTDEKSVELYGRQIIMCLKGTLPDTAVPAQNALIKTENPAGTAERPRASRCTPAGRTRIR